VGFELEYRIGNRKVSQQEWERHMFQEAPRQVAREAVDRELRKVRCPTHGQSPNATITDRADGFEVHIEGCCDALVERAQKALAN
jgi:hypothetical protein